MHVIHHRFFPRIVSEMRRLFLRDGEEVDVGEWQAMDIRDRPEMVTYELRNVTFQMFMPETHDALVRHVRPNMPWAEDHFKERVSGKPLNPPPSNEWWPYAQQGNADHKHEDDTFSHTYPERFWPKWAGLPDSCREEQCGEHNHQGIRFAYGDLSNVVKLLRKRPFTRQAYLPVWFPEDLTAAEQWEERVPCTLGYHFLRRGDKLHITYHIRSCDFMRHFRDDVYMACRLAEWVAYTAWSDSVKVGDLTMHIGSFHIFAGDLPILKKEQTDEFTNSLHSSL